jgi:hypothetical protein
VRRCAGRCSQRLTGAPTFPANDMQTYYTAEELEIIRQHKRVAHAKMAEVVREAGVTLHPRIAALSHKGFFASLTVEQQEKALAYRGPEDHGPAQPE